jgi:hypothetical protein
MDFLTLDAFSVADGKNSSENAMQPIQMMDGVTDNSFFQGLPKVTQSRKH